MNTGLYLVALCAVSFVYAAETPNMTAQIQAAREATLAATRIIQEIPLSVLATAHNNPFNPATNVPAVTHAWEQFHQQLAYHTHLFHHGLPPH